MTGVTHDSRAVQPGDLYAALPGTRVHGAEFSQAAVAAGAVAILTDPAGRDRAVAAGVPVFVVADPRARLGEVACWMYGNPSGRLRLIGVTGTSGKTTTSYLIEAGLRMAGHETGLIGGVETRIGADVQPSQLTTPEATDLQALLAAMAERGVTAAAMEVSSHALALGRVAGTHYDVAIFTNLSQDHLDFHASMEDYFAAKATLFTPRYADAGVVNLDDPHGRRLAADAGIPITTFSAAGNAAADWRAENVRVGADGSTFRVIGPGGVEADASLNLVGPYNVANALGAIVGLVEAGTGLDDAVAGVGPARRARLAGTGRGRRCRTRPDRAGGLLAQARCGGGGAERAAPGHPGQPDHRARLRRRPGPGQAAADGSRRGQPGRRGLFTSDNPRSEDPLAILAAMLDGALGVPQQHRAHVIVEPDRAAAIGLAVSAAAKGDVILVAGKGHERGQYVAGRVLPFDDRAVTADALRRRAHETRTADPKGTVIPLPLEEDRPDHQSPAGRCADPAAGRRPGRH